MIEILGAGVAGAGGSWVFRRLCARIESPSLVGIVSADPEVRSALFDVITGARIADEGRVWIDRVPVMAATRRRVRSRVADLRHGPGARHIRPDQTDDRAASIRLAISAAVARGHSHVILPDRDDLSEADRAALAQHVGRLVHASRVSVFLGVRDAASLRGVADRILILAATTPDLQLVS